MRYLVTPTINAALEHLWRNADSRAPRPWRIVAGGTDFYPAQNDRPIEADLLDVTKVEGLRGVEETEAGWRIGAATRWSDIAKILLPPCFDALKVAAREVGSVQIQNAGTIAGNLCNASPAADGAPPLLTLDAEVELRSRGGGRRLPLGAFITGVRKTALRPEEIMVAIHIPRPPASARSAFLKLGSRKYLVISTCMVSVLIASSTEGRVALARVSIGACSPVARRLPDLEAKLTGALYDARELAMLVEPADMRPLSPIDDIRAGAVYRREAAAELTSRALALAVTGSEPRDAES